MAISAFKAQKEKEAAEKAKKAKEAAKPKGQWETIDDLQGIVDAAKARGNSGEVESP